MLRFFKKAPLRAASGTIFALFVIMLYHFSNDKKMSPTPSPKLLWSYYQVQWWDGKEKAEELYCQSDRHLKSDSELDILKLAHFVMLARDDEEVELKFSHFLAIK